MFHRSDISHQRSLDSHHDGRQDPPRSCRCVVHVVEEAISYSLRTSSPRSSDHFSSIFPNSESFTCQIPHRKPVHSDRVSRQAIKVILSSANSPSRPATSKKLLTRHQYTDKRSRISHATLQTNPRPDQLYQGILDRGALATTLLAPTPSCAAIGPAAVTIPPVRQPGSWRGEMYIGLGC